ncbi:hypothetical protein MLD38_040188 [Melastoma candidum]|uniref:Uncharacterized protein n=1 Tax=Melastoma candidum TaxID=119954 RepID=A0ACB9L578_9MYRT|nr:hypothetical protein MLD38_040188 [Melastoma candidum]
MTLSPWDCLLQWDPVEGYHVRCMGISTIPGHDITILGGSKSVNVSTLVNTERNDFVVQSGHDNSGLPGAPTRLSVTTGAILFSVLSTIAFL